MDSLEAKAVAFGSVLRLNPKTWAQAEAEGALKTLKGLRDAKKITMEVYDDVIVEISGNHSANRQKFQSGGFLERKEADSALFRAIRAYISKSDAELEKLSK